MDQRIDALKENLPLRNGVGVRTAHPTGLIAFEKPPGLLAHPNPKPDNKRAFIAAAYDHKQECYYWGEGKTLCLVNRLDSPTSGIILGALDRTVARAVKKVFAAHSVYKRYDAIVVGKPKQQQGYWRDDTIKIRKDDKLRVLPLKHKTAQSTQTAFTLVSVNASGLGVSLLSLEPKTGRTHQLRVQCAHHHLPIVGDRTYGQFDFNRKVAATIGTQRLFLHAADIQLEFDFAGKRHTFTATSPMPDAFDVLMGGNY